MKRTWNLLGGLLVLAVASLILVLIFKAPGPVSAPQAPLVATATTVSILPTPPATQPPEPSPTVWTPGPPPTDYAISTPTSRPTTTRRPGPTATPFPTWAPASNPAGTILYTAADGQTILALPIDAQGQKAAEPAALPLSLDFAPWIGGVSPDGRYLLVLQPAEPGGIPYVANLESGQVWPVLRDNPYPVGVFSGWHPDSRHILFWGDSRALWLVNVETGESTTLALINGTLQGAVISPDGEEIVYIGRSSTSRRTMWKVSAAGSDAQPLFDLGGPSYVFGWSPDGSYILYVGGPGTELTGTPTPGGPLWLMNPESQNRRPLSGRFIFGWGFNVVWSPNGQWIAFTGLDESQSFGCLRKDPPPDPETCRFEGTAVYIENVVTGETRRLAAGIDPIWSPDGSMLAFLSIQSGAPEIWTVRINGSGLQQLTADGQPKSQVIWAPIRR